MSPIRASQEQLCGVERVARVFVVHGEIRAQAVFRVGVGVLVVADAGHAEAGKAMGEVAEGRAGVGGLVHIRGTGAMHHHHRREGAFALGQRQNTVRGVVFARAQRDRFLDIAALVRRFAVLVRAHGGEPQRAEPALRVESQRQGGVGICKRAIGDGHAVTVLRAGVRRLNALKRAERAGELRPDGGQTVRTAEGFLHGLVRIVIDRGKIAGGEAQKHIFRFSGRPFFRQRGQRREPKRKNQQKCHYTAHTRTPFLRSL